MATKTFEELKQLAIQIRDEKTNKQNTATRIGTQMLEHLDKLEQDYYDKTATDEELKERDEKLTELENNIYKSYLVTNNILSGNINKATNSEPGILSPKGYINSNLSAWKTFTINTTNSINKNHKYFVEVDSVAEKDGDFATVAFFKKDDNTFICSFNITGKQIIAVPYNEYVKISCQSSVQFLNYSDEILAIKDYTDNKVKDMFNKIDIVNSFVTTNVGLAETITEDKENYQVGLLYNEGNINSDLSYFKTFFVKNENLGNKYLFVKSYYDGNIANMYSNIAIFKDDLLIYSGRLNGYQVIALPVGYTLKTSQDTILHPNEIGIEYSTSYAPFAITNEQEKNKIQSYNFVRYGIDITGDITNNSSDYTEGILNIDGSINTDFNWYKTFEVRNTDSSNKFLFIKAYHTGNIPNNFATFCVYEESTNKVVEYGRLNGIQIIAIQKGYYAKICQDSYNMNSNKIGVEYSYDFFSTLDSEKSWFIGKKGVWLGTSIPAQGYPSLVATKLGMTIYNEAQGSSPCRKGRNKIEDAFGDDLGITNLSWPNVVYSLSMSQQERLRLFKRWTTADRKALMISEDGYSAEQVANVKGYSEYMGGDFYGEDTDGTVTTPTQKPLNIMADNYKDFRKLCYSCCWDNSTDIEPEFGEIKGKIEKYKDQNIDVWFFDHGHNDGFNYEVENIDDIPEDEYDRNYFIGSANFIISKILSINPKARVIIIGHYTNNSKGTNHPVEVTSGQIKISEYWQIPIVKLWENIPLSPARTITTTGYWDNSHIWHDNGFNGNNHVGNNYSGINQNPRQENGIWVHDLTPKQIWFWDDLHPSTIEVKEMYSDYLVSAIKGIL